MDNKNGSSKKKNLLIGGALVAVLGGGGVAGWNAMNNDQKTANGFENSNTINDSVNVNVDAVNKTFDFADASIKTAPNSDQQPITDIEAFNQIIGSLDGKTTNKEISLPISGVQFEFKSAEVSPTSKELLKGLASLYKKTSQKNEFIVDGFACNIGTDSINNEISKKRAMAVKQVLEGEGINESKIKVNWYGKSRNSEFQLNDIAEYRRVLVSFN